MSEDMEHTVAAKPARAASPGDNIKQQIRPMLERIEALEADKKAVAADLRDIYTEAKSNGLSVKALRAVVRMRAQDSAERREEQATLEIYMHAAGLL